jgi:4-hydroxy-L-threonine phosphate dehydrogenase PdxA
MLGCKKMFSILYTHHIPLRDVSTTIKYKKIKKFLLRVEDSLHVEKIAVLGFNPHAGDGGVIGNEDFKIMCRLHAKYFNHKYKVICTCNKSRLRQWIFQLDDILI